MPEYIEREAFKSKYLCCGYLPEMSEEEFDNFPAADVAPVVHGRWITTRESGISKTVKCSACGYDFYFTEYGQLNIDKMPHCPHCGAKNK